MPLSLMTWWWDPACRHHRMWTGEPCTFSAASSALGLGSTGRHSSQHRAGCRLADKEGIGAILCLQVGDDGLNSLNQDLPPCHFHAPSGLVSY